MTRLSSEALTLLKYDIEVSGFGSQAMGHVDAARAALDENKGERHGLRALRQRPAHRAGERGEAPAPPDRAEAPEEPQ